MFKPIIVPGSVEVEAISGHVTEDYFVLYVTTKEKYCNVDAWCANPTIVSLSFEKGKSTDIYFPLGWVVEASVSRYTCQIVGVREPSHEKMLVGIPFEVATNEVYATRKSLGMPLD